MRLIPPEGETIRYRPRMGEPRCVVEHVAQWIWRWRTNLMLVYLVICVTALILLWR